MSGIQGGSQTTGPRIVEIGNEEHLPASASDRKRTGALSDGKRPDLLSGNIETGYCHKGGNHHQNQRPQAVLIPTEFGFRLCFGFAHNRVLM
ncbi:MAG: hypothetical protein VCF25_26120 [Candidatus Poribacteria bacterium]